MSYGIYVHRTLDTNEVFYIGRAGKNHHTHPRSINQSNRSFEWKDVVSVSGFKSEMILENLTSEEANQWEKWAIKLYKIKNNLVNKTSGGQGVEGLKQTPERIENRVNKLKALFKSGALDGLKLKNKTTTAQAKWRKVYCVELDKTFQSLKEAAAFLGYKRESGIQRALSKKKTNLGLTWEYVEESVGY